LSLSTWSGIAAGLLIAAVILTGGTLLIGWILWLCDRLSTFRLALAAGLFGIGVWCFLACAAVICGIGFATVINSL
jgi:hypothetical protein